MAAALEVSSLPRAARPLASELSIAFTPATFQRVLVLLVGAVLAPGRRTVAACLWAARALAAKAGGDSSSYRRVFSLAVWDLWPLGRVLAGAVIALVPAGEPIIVDGDDTVAQHRGDKVYGKGCHGSTELAEVRDAVRSSHSHTVWKWGHKWVVLAINVTFPFCSRPWALPVLAALYRDPATDKKQGRRHKTPAQLARGLVAALVRWFPDRRFILLASAVSSAERATGASAATSWPASSGAAAATAATWVWPRSPRRWSAACTRRPTCTPPRPRPRRGRRAGAAGRGSRGTSCPAPSKWWRPRPRGSAAAPPSAGTAAASGRWNW
jgi:hypothetical protein